MQWAETNLRQTSIRNATVEISQWMVHWSTAISTLLINYSRFRILVAIVIMILLLSELMNLFSNSSTDGIETSGTLQMVDLSAQKDLNRYLSDSVLSPDGYIRHCISNNVIGFTDQRYTKKMFLKNGTAAGGEEQPVNRRNSFKQVFDNRVWVGGQGSNYDAAYSGIQASGMGSCLRAAQEVMGALHIIIDHIKLRHRLDRVRLLDIPCGDMAWMSRLLETRPDVDYVGFDIVPDLIENHRKLYTNKHPNWQFYLVDVVSEGINSSFRDVNLVLSRHMLQHLTTSDALTVLGHISDLSRRQSTPVYFFTTTWSQCSRNDELDMKDVGRFRPLNLELPPYSLEPPLCLLNDGSPPDLLCCYLGLWRLPLYQVEECKTLKANEVHNTFGFDGEPLYSCLDWTLAPEQRGQVLETIPRSTE